MSFIATLIPGHDISVYLYLLIINNNSYEQKQKQNKYLSLLRYSLFSIFKFNKLLGFFS